MADNPPPKDLLDWMGLSDVPDWKVARPLGAFLAVALLLLFFLALAAAVATLGKAFGTTSEPASGGLGAGALIVALLGAPFLIWNTIIKHKALGFQKEGHLTDRLSKAVEQLGAEKKVDRIGRPVTIWTGKAERFSCAESLAEKKYIGKPRTKVSDREWRQTWNLEKDDVEESFQVRVATWPAERTIIQWQGEVLAMEDSEAVGLEGEWQAFSETFPNIAIRIGGILSLERIAQDSTEYDKGRDHVRVMEILCAYVRENAPASEARVSLRERYEIETADGDQVRGMKDHQFADLHGITPTDLDEMVGIDRLKMWADALPAPRADIALALQVIGRRNANQREAEARWGKDATADAVWVFDQPCPVMVDRDDDTTLPGVALVEYLQSLDTWKTLIRGYRGYRLDLRATNLQGADISDLNLSGARLEKARIEGANLGKAQLQGANLREAQMRGANLRQTKMQAAMLRQAWIEGANLAGAQMEGAFLSRARMQGAFLSGARMQEAELSEAQMQVADLSGVRMQEAYLRGAQMQGARLSGARMEGADLSEARIDEATLRTVRMDVNTRVGGANLRAAMLKDLDLSSVPISQGQIDAAFGDGSVILSKRLTRPAHWPQGTLYLPESYTEWRKWQADPASYTPPAP